MTAAFNTVTGARRWQVTAAEGIAAMDVVVDGTRVYVTGGYFDWWIVAMNTNGAVRWQTLRNDAVTGDELPDAVFVLADGTTVVSGTGGPVISPARPGSDPSHVEHPRH